MSDAIPADPLEAITQRTLAHYALNAQSFWEGTRDHDVAQNIVALLDAIVAAPPYAILDFGCGPGRDLATFDQLGHQAIGLEGVPEFASMARALSGCTVWEQDFLNLDLPPLRFDGIFANATLQHVPSATLPKVLQALRSTLKPGGVLFASIPRGDDEEGWYAGRYSVRHSFAGWQRHLQAAGFDALSHFYRPAGLPRAQQPWLATVWRKP